MTIILKDGTELTVTETEESFGNAYNTETPLEESIFSDDNLSAVTIDGTDKGRMVLDFFRPDGLQFYLREPTETEAAISALQEEVLPANIYRLVGASATVTVPAGASANVQEAFTVPDGFYLASFRQIAIERVFGNEQDIIVRQFASAANGTKANISLRNLGAEEATVKLVVTGLFVRK